MQWDITQSLKRKKKEKGHFDIQYQGVNFQAHMLSVISLTYLPDTEGHICMIPLTGDEVTRCIKTESRMVVAWGMRGAVWGFTGVMKVPGMGSGDGHSTSWMHLLSLNCTLIKS